MVSVGGDGFVWCLCMCLRYFEDSGCKPGMVLVVIVLDVLF